MKFAIGLLLLLPSAVFAQNTFERLFPSNPVPVTIEGISGVQFTQGDRKLACVMKDGELIVYRGGDQMVTFEPFGEVGADVKRFCKNALSEEVQVF